MTARRVAAVVLVAAMWALEGRLGLVLAAVPAVVLSFRQWRRLASRANLRRIMGPAGRHPCTYCGGHADTWDHLVPRALGGTDDRANLVPACRSCNSSKGDTPLNEWIRR